jgi:hypothetical protein
MVKNNSLSMSRIHLNSNESSAMQPTLVLDKNEILDKVKVKLMNRSWF